MKTTLRSKTLTASLPQTPEALYAWALSPEPWAKKTITRQVRNDSIRSVDLVLPAAEAELTIAIRIFPNGEGSEVVMTLIQPRGIPDAIFNEHVRWADHVLRGARKAPAQTTTPKPSPESPADASLSKESPEPQEQPATSNIPTSGKKLFIGNLPFDWTEEMLSALFVDVAETTRVEIARFRGRGGRSRGFGFVEMITEEAAQVAIGKLHDTLAGTRKMVVRLARSQESRPIAAPAVGEIDGNRLTPETEQNSATPATHRSPRPHTPRRRPERPQRPAGGPARSSGRPAPEVRTRASRLDRPYKEIDIVNNSGYEYFPRRSRAE